VAVSAGGHTLWAGTRDPGLSADIRRWHDPGKPPARYCRYKGYLQGLAISAAGDLVASFQSAGEVRVWRLGGKKPPTRAADEGRVERGESVQQIALSPDGRLVAGTAFWVRDSVCPVYVWDTRTGQRRFRLESPFSVAGVAFHPTRPLLATAGDAGAAAYWDVQTGREIIRLALPTDKLYAVAFAPDGLRCAAAGVGTVVVWDVD
jgi:WD40 repeat protein